MIKYTIQKVNDEKLMLTRHEPIDPPIKGLPPYYTSSLTCNKSEITHIINVLSDYVNETDEG